MASRIQRPDRRAETEIRALSCRQGFLKQADGSAQFSAGGRSTVICGVYGPAEARVYDERLDSAFVEVRYRPDIGVPQTGDTWNREWLRELFERVIMCHLHPRTLVQLNFQVVQNDGS
ncbi:exosome non-catalytic core subunit rrp46, partial [Spiromyces aspiralis]